MYSRKWSLNIQHKNRNVSMMMTTRLLFNEFILIFFLLTTITQKIYAFIPPLFGTISNKVVVVVHPRHLPITARRRSHQKYFSDDDPSISIRKYQHKDKKWNLTYLYKPPSPTTNENKQTPIIFVHPVGIGLSSWFWVKVMSEFGKEEESNVGSTSNSSNPPMYAVDLIGCGLEHGGSAWYPEKEGLFFPLSWVEGVETLIRDIVKSECFDEGPGGGGNSADVDADGDEGGILSRKNGCTIIVQGGLASVGFMLASRNPTIVSKLILTSPPTYKDMVTPIPQHELEKNYNFLKSKLGNLAFTLLESRYLIRLFSDLFLFKGKCDEDWLDFAMQGVSDQARTPVQVFNAGLINHRGYEQEMLDIHQPVLIVNGSGDKRSADREPYATKLKNCRLTVLEGVNVMPWENPRDVVKMIKKFVKE